MFTIGHAHTIAELRERKETGTLEDTLVSCEEALAFLPALHLPENRRKPALNGLETTVRTGSNGKVRLYGGGTFLGIGLVSDGSVKLAVNLTDGER